MKTPDKFVTSRAVSGLLVAGGVALAGCTSTASEPVADLSGGGAAAGGSQAQSTGGSQVSSSSGSAALAGASNGGQGGQASAGHAGSGGSGGQPGPTTCTTPAPVKVIFDTDIGPDCDDAGAVAMLHTLADLCEVEILGMVSATSFEWGAGALDAINTYYGRPDIPIGALKEPDFLDRSDYSQYLAENFPNDLKSAKNAPDAVELFHSVLEAQPDGSVTIISVGPLRNAKNLLSSPGGRELVAKKVKQWSVMGGFYPGTPGAEWNFEQDGAAAKEAIEDWPTPIMFSGAEVGSGVTTGTRLFSETEEQNPVRKAYQLSTGDGGRLSWDLTSVLYAARGPEPFFRVVSDGYNQVGDNGVNDWQASPNRGHAYLVKKDNDGKVLGWAMDELVVGSKLDLLPKTAPLSKAGWKASAEPGGNLAAQGVDGDYESQWSTGRPMAVGDWFVVDMGQAQTFNRVELDQHWTGGEYPRGYELYLSEDGVNWGSPITSGRGSAVTIMAFDVRTIRYLKVVQTGILSAENRNTTVPWMMRELSVFLEAAQ